MGQLTLNWTPATQLPTVNVVGYTIFWGTTAGNHPNRKDVTKSEQFTLTGLNPGTKYFCSVKAYTPGGLLFSEDSPEGSAVARPSVETGIFTKQIPAILNGKDSSPLELGTEFIATSPGVVTGVRFYKVPGETGTHVGNIWSAVTKTIIASASFINETTSGWQTAKFSTPIRLVPNTNYMVSVDQNTLFPMTRYGLSTPILNGALRTALTNNVNGFIAAKGKYPTGNYQNTCYFVDALFLED